MCSRQITWLSVNRFTQEHARGGAVRLRQDATAARMGHNKTDWGAAYRYHFHFLQLAVALKGVASNLDNEQ